VGHDRIAPGTRILERKDAPPALVRKRCSIEIYGSKKRVEIEGGYFSVGSARENDLVLDDRAVSARHFEISIGEDGVRLRDLLSTNGTFVGGLRTRDVYLAGGVEIRAGETAMRFDVEEDEIEVPLSRRTNFGELLGHSAAMRAVFAILERAAKTDSTVLVQGESGTGKELAARAIHDSSARKDGAFVVFDCGAASASLIESQLFGHVRGAFTGATDARAGVFEEADGGTLVLDEIGELPLELQPKLLRALEQKSVTRLGESKPHAVDVRFVACTNRNLAEEARAGRFRQDLFFRLSVLSVRMPALRERREEIPRLVNAFLAKLGPERDVDPRTMALLASHEWPGNVRELRNVVERMIALPDMPAEDWIRGSSKERAMSAIASASIDMPFHEAKQRCIDDFERAYLQALLAAHGDNLSEAARVSGLSRQSCYRLMHKHGLADESE
jgi:two-component system, NtrC family, response regulator GlrR